MPGWAARARASGVDREPGHTTAWATPPRTHSSTRVAAKAAWTSARPGDRACRRYAHRRSPMPTTRPPLDPTGRPGRPVTARRDQRARTAAGAGPRLHPDRPGVGRDGRRPGHRPPGGARSTCPATAARRGWPPTLPTGPACSATPAGRAAYLGYSMGARFCLHLALARPDLVERLVLISGTAGIEDADERRPRRALRRGAGRRARPAAGGRRPTTGRADLRAPVAGRPDVRRHRRRGQRVGRAAAQHRTGAGLEPAPGRHRHPGAAVGPARRAWPCRCWSSPAETTRSSPPSADGWPRPSGPTPPTVVAGAGHAPTCNSPTRWPRLVRAHLGRPTGPAADRPTSESGRPGSTATAPPASSTPKASCSRPVAGQHRQQGPPSASP